MSIARKNILFGMSVSRIKTFASEIERASHLFEATTRYRYSTQMDAYDLRSSADALRKAADELDIIARRLGQGEECLQAAE